MDSTAPPPANGECAPRFVIGHAGSVGVRSFSLSHFSGQAVVLVFLGPEAFDDASPEVLATIRAELRGLGAVLVALSTHGVWTFAADDEAELFAGEFELSAEEVRAAYGAYGVPWGGAALFVVDAEAQLRFCHRLNRPEEATWPSLASALSTAGRAQLVPGTGFRPSRREVVVGSLVAALSLAFLDGCRGGRMAAVGSVSRSVGETEVTLNVNGQPRTLRIDARVTLLDALRERLGLPGTKKGCDHGQCGACTVLVDGRRVNACLTLAIATQGPAITTIEGLSRGDDLHPMQAAFAALDAFQCGYCTPGQIVSAVGLLREGQATSDAEIREQMSGNICRCGAYPNIVAAIQRARKEL
jgi:xanthine dehydrogenase YagT iron-sulfur-binding subunit